ncbi:MAG: MATE family efflux transporter [Eubacteriales bacterium]|nr:MATE family efflux transporter [Eubacteriales bacterium]
MGREQEQKAVEADHRIYIMAEEKPSKAILKMGVPVTMGMLFMVVYNLVDTYFVGLLHNDYQLAATNLAYPVMMIMVAVASIVGNGGASYIARCIGAQKKEEANHTLTIGFELIVISSVIIAVVGLLCLNPIVTILGAKENTFLYTKEYVLVMFVGAIFTMGNYAIGQLLRSEGSTMYSMVGMIAGTVANIILDPVFIFGFKMEIKGAAIATVLGNAVGVLVFIWFYIRKKTMLTPSVKLLHMDLQIIKEIMWVGIPHTLEQIFTTTAMIVNNNLASGYGELTVAAMGISNKIMSFGNYIYQGFAAGAQPLMGYNYGAKNFSRMKVLIRSGVVVISSIEVCIMVVFGIFAPYLIGIFTDSTEVISIGAKTLRAAMLMLPFVGGTSMARNTFNSMGKPLYSFGITIVRQLILYIPALLLFNSLWGYTGLIHAQPVEEMVCMVLSLLLLLRSLKRFEQNEKIGDKKV